MANFKVLSLYIFLITMTLQRTTAIPFLYNSGQAILTSLYNSAASPETQDSSSNIEDLRVPKDTKAESSRLDKEEQDFFNKTENEEEEKNEATPGFIQKKIGKILRKLQLFSTLRNTLWSNKEGDVKEEEEDQTDNKIERLESRSQVNNVFKIARPNENRFTLYSNQENFIGDNSENEARKMEVDSQVLEGTVKNSEVVEVKASTEKTSDETNSDLANVEDLDEEETTNPDDDTKLSLSPGSIGVYISELIASIGTLLYGAALQVANAGNATTT